MQISRRADGWRGQGSRGLSAEALGAWLDFWSGIYSKAVEPALALTARGTLQVEWFQSSRRHLDLEFATKDKVFFGLFDGKAVYEGVDTAKALLPWLANHRAHPLKWHEA
jgi:hypothetical protein